MRSSRRIGAGEAAARLGVKRETLYAYVSRGMLISERSDDGRSSTFDPIEIERLAGRGRRTKGAGEVDVVTPAEISAYGAELATLGVSEGHFYTDNGNIPTLNLAAMKAL